MWRVCGVTGNMGMGVAEYIYTAVINTLAVFTDFRENVQLINERWKLHFLCKGLKLGVRIIWLEVCDWRTWQGMKSHAGVKPVCKAKWQSIY